MVARNKAAQLSESRPRASISSESSASSSDTPDGELVVDATKNGLKTRLGNSGSGTDLDTGSEGRSRSGHESGSEHSDSVEDEDSNSTLGPDSNATAKRVNDSVGKRAADSVSTKKRKRGDDEVDVDVEEDEGAVNVTREKGKARTRTGGREGGGKLVGGEEAEEEVKILSHKEQRRLRKKQKTLAASTNQPSSNSTKDPTTSRKQHPTKPTTPRRQNSVWVGNLSYRTTSEALRAFFESAGAKEVTRVHMPTKGIPGLENMKMKMKGVKTVKENRGFAYVDFSTPEAKKLAISLSEKNLDGRRLLIKDGDDFGGRPDSTPIDPDPSSSPVPQTDSKTDSQPNQSTTSPQSNPHPILKGPTTKTAQKILKAQKQPPCPCLFLGNLGFEATEERIREMIEGHARALVVGKMRRRKEKAKKTKEREGEKVMEVDEEGDEKVDVEVDVGIKKIRMGTFEDSGLCKGFAFVDFKSTLHSTAVLTNPANHFLDGRALVVEYASAEAARRGGYRPQTKAVRFKLPKKVRVDPASGRGNGEEEDERGGRGRKKRSGENKYNDWKKKLKKGDGRNDNLNSDLEGRNQIRNQRSESKSNPNPKSDSDNYTRTNPTKEYQRGERRQHQRQTPGAALASAQRGEKIAIVPSEGTKLKFS